MNRTTFIVSNCFNVSGVYFELLSETIFHHRQWLIITGEKRQKERPPSPHTAHARNSSSILRHVHLSSHALFRDVRVDFTHSLFEINIRCRYRRQESIAGKQNARAHACLTPIALIKIPRCETRRDEFQLSSARPPPKCNHYAV